VLGTVRSHDQWNTTIYSNDDRYRGVRNLRTLLFMHEEDMRERGIARFDLVDVTSFARDGSTREVRGVRVIAHDRVRVEFLGDELDLRAPGAADHDTMAGGPEALRHRAAQLPVGTGDQDVHQPPPGTHSTAGKRVLNTSPEARPRVPADRRT